MRVDYRCCAPSGLPEQAAPEQSQTRPAVKFDDAPPAAESGGGFCTIL